MYIYMIYVYQLLYNMYIYTCYKKTLDHLGPVNNSCDTNLCFHLLHAKSLCAAYRGRSRSFAAIAAKKLRPGDHSGPNALWVNAEKPGDDFWALSSSSVSLSVNMFFHLFYP